MNMFAMITVVALSIVSIVLQLVKITDYSDDTNSSLVSLIFLFLMFVVPMGKRLLGELGRWIFILVGVGSLLSQSYAYGEHLDADSNVLLGLSVLSTIVSSYVGHMLKESRPSGSNDDTIDQRKVNNYVLVNVIKFLTALSAFVTLIVNVAERHYSTNTLTTILVLTMSSLFIYILLAATVAFINPKDQVDLYVELLCGLGPLIQMYKVSQSTTDFKIISSAISLSGLSILVGHTGGSTQTIVALTFFTLALVCDHVAVAYYKDSYIRKLRKLNDSSTFMI